MAQQLHSEAVCLCNLLLVLRVLQALQAQLNHLFMHKMNKVEVLLFQTYR